MLNETPHQPAQPRAIAVKHSNFIRFPLFWRDANQKAKIWVFLSRIWALTSPRKMPWATTHTTRATNSITQKIQLSIWWAQLRENSIFFVWNSFFVLFNTRLNVLRILSTARNCFIQHRSIKKNLFILLLRCSIKPAIFVLKSTVDKVLKTFSLAHGCLQVCD